MADLTCMPHSEMTPRKFYVVDRENDYGDDAEFVLAGPFDDQEQCRSKCHQMRLSGRRGALVLLIANHG